MFRCFVSEKKNCISLFQIHLVLGKNSEGEGHGECTEIRKDSFETSNSKKENYVSGTMNC